MAVEAALLIPLLIIIAFGMIETALLLRDHVNATTLARAGARIASAEPRFGFPPDHATGPSFAREAADGMERAASTLPRNAIDGIYIFRADPTTGQPQSACPGTDCLYYKWNDLPVPAGRFVYQEASNVPGAFNPASINACLGDPNAQSLGVRVIVDHPWLLGFFPGSPKVTAQTVMKFEPLLPDHTFAGVAPGCKPPTP